MILAFPITTHRLLQYPIELYPTPQRLNDPEQRNALFEAIVEHGGVRKACEALRINRSSLYLYAATHPEFDTAFKAARKMAAEMMWDECIEIADDKTGDWMTVSDGRGGTKQVPNQEVIQRSRVRIETRMRVAGKLVEHLADKPMIEQNTYNDNRQIIVTDEKRAQLQERLKRLQQGSKNADNP